LRLSPGRIGAHYFMGTALLLKGETENALQAMQQEPYELLQLLGLTMVNYSLGNTEASNLTLHQLISKHATEAAYNIAHVLAWRGEIDAAFEWLEKARSFADPGLVDILGEPLFRNLQGDPRWLQFLTSIGKSP